MNIFSSGKEGIRVTLTSLRRPGNRMARFRECSSPCFQLQACHLISDCVGMFSGLDILFAWKLFIEQRVRFEAMSRGFFKLKLQFIQWTRCHCQDCFTQEKCRKFGLGIDHQHWKRQRLLELQSSLRMTRTNSRVLSAKKKHFGKHALSLKESKRSKMNWKYVKERRTSKIVPKYSKVT